MPSKRRVAHDEPFSFLEIIMKIVKADCGVMPKSLFDKMPIVTVTHEDGTSEEIFSYYPDEISFTSAELIGLTREEAIDLKRRKDIAYLRS